ncbi:MAG TPA: heavy metal translocating P-type ATPase, partial [Flavobacterium sp.]|nr:heavy metal translocating P-type ATPase [Flavobacterium sp.]
MNKPDGCCSSHSEHTHSNDDGHDHHHSHGAGSHFEMFFPAVISFCLLLIGIVFDNYFPQSWFIDWIRIGWYILAYIPVGFPVLKEAFESFRNGSLFSEFLLMSIATLGAFAIGQFPEGVAVMLFYTIGEIFQGLAVQRAKSNIKSLLDQRPDSATILVG